MIMAHTSYWDKHFNLIEGGASQMCSRSNSYFPILISVLSSINLDVYPWLLGFLGLSSAHCMRFIGLGERGNSSYDEVL